jgi:hypothetical protein
MAGDGTFHHDGDTVSLQFDCKDLGLAFKFAYSTQGKCYQSTISALSTTDYKLKTSILTSDNCFVLPLVPLRRRSAAGGSCNHGSAIGFGCHTSKSCYDSWRLLWQFLSPLLLS